MYFKKKKFNFFKFTFLKKPPFKYAHELIDYWLKRSELRYNKYIQSIKIESWWELEEKFEFISQLFINDKQIEVIFLHFIF